MVATQGFSVTATHGGFKTLYSNCATWWLHKTLPSLRQLVVLKGFAVTVLVGGSTRFGVNAPNDGSTAVSRLYRNCVKWWLRKGLP
jgi:hypothetical protein